MFYGEACFDKKKKKKKKKKKMLVRQAIWEKNNFKFKPTDKMSWTDMAG